MWLIDELDKTEIEDIVTEVFYKVCCNSKDLHDSREWRRLCGKNVPDMCKDVAVECFRRDWMPVDTQVVREVLDRLTYAGDWVTPLDEQIKKSLGE